ncbi:hypothetical protein [Tomitella biformata]|nr:hypothetical protein [Tomitella biformata]
MGSLSSVAELLVKSLIDQISAESIGELLATGSKEDTTPAG